MTSKYKAKSRPVSNTKLRSISYCTSCGYSCSNISERNTCTCDGTYQVKKVHYRDKAEMKTIHTWTNHKS